LLDVNGTANFIGDVTINSGLDDGTGLGANGQYLMTDGSDAVWSYLSGSLIQVDTLRSVNGADGDTIWTMAQFYINGELQDQWSGEVDWTLATYNLTSGEYNLKWEYAKDGSMDNGDDCGWLDYIILPSASDNTLAAGFVVDNYNPCEGETVQFTSASNGDVTSWNWTFEGGDPTTSTDENPTVTYTTPGDYDVSLEVDDGTNTANITKENFITVHHCTGIADVEPSVSLYPNPNDGVFYVDIQGMNHANIKVINSVGSNVYREDNINTDNSMKRFDLSYQAEGIYMMIVENGDQRFIEKVVIK
jgi:PKD repeat protein